MGGHSPAVGPTLATSLAFMLSTFHKLSKTFAISVPWSNWFKDSMCLAICEQPPPPHYLFVLSLSVCHIPSSRDSIPVQRQPSDLSDPQLHLAADAFHRRPNRAWFRPVSPDYRFQ